MIIINSPIFCQNSTSQKYLPNTLIIKVKAESKTNLRSNRIENDDLENIFTSINAQKIIKKHPNHSSPKKRTNKYGDNLVDLSLIYTIEYDSDESIEKIISQIKANPIIEYVQPHYLPELLYVPNDSLINKQYYFELTKAYEGWDINKGDSKIVIGITDTGTDIDHPDLAPNFAYNTDDPINGIDDDNDGFIDNYRGWDTGENDNNPQVGTNDHGIWVGGMACAQTDNTTGVAGTGYNCKQLPLKICNDAGVLVAAYEAIIYAADHGCQVINCSWGSSIPNPYGQDVVNYATFNKDALVIGAAGNDNNDVPFYPASFENVLSVAATNDSDIKSDNSTYGTNVDLCAPGTMILSTGSNGSYFQTFTGTSFAAPIVAGYAGIVRAQFPDYNALQIAEQLKSTCDDIYNIGANLDYVNLLGTGRINLYRALTETDQTSIVFANKTFTDNNDGFLTNEDTISLYGTFTNYLAQSGNISVNISTSSPYITLLNNHFTLDALGTLESVINENDPIQFVINENAPSDTEIQLMIRVSDATYNGIYYAELKVNPTYTEIHTEYISATMTSIGRIGYLSDDLDYGIGFTYRDDNTRTYDAGLVMGNSVSSVSKSVVCCTDFTPDTFIVFKASDYADNYFVATFSNKNETDYNVQVRQHCYSWDDYDNRNFFIIEYELINTGNNQITDFYLGLYTDWDLGINSQNRTLFNDDSNFAYTFYTADSSEYFGSGILSSNAFYNYAFDLVEGGNEGISLNDGYNAFEAYYSLSNSRWEAGVTTDIGYDVSNILSYGPYNIESKDTIIVGYSLLAAESLYEMQIAQIRAKQKYELIRPTTEIKGIVNNSSIAIYPNPNKGEFDIVASRDDLNLISTVSILDITGKMIFESEVNEHQTRIDISSYPSGVYFLKIFINDEIVIKKVILD